LRGERILAPVYFIEGAIEATLPPRIDATDTVCGIHDVSDVT